MSETAMRPNPGRRALEGGVPSGEQTRAGARREVTRCVLRYSLIPGLTSANTYRHMSVIRAVGLWDCLTATSVSWF